MATTFSEFEDHIRSKIKLQENVELDMEFKKYGKWYVLNEMEDLEEGLKIRVSVISQSISSPQ